MQGGSAGVERLREGARQPHDRPQHLNHPTGRWRNRRLFRVRAGAGRMAPVSAWLTFGIENYPSDALSVPGEEFTR